MNGQEYSKAAERLIRAGGILVLGASLWAGVAMSGMSPLWAMVLSAAGGVVAMFIGMVTMGVKYRRDVEVLKSGCEAMLETMRVEVEGMRADVAKQRKEFAVAAVGIAKNISENVAGRVVSRYVRMLPNQEHVSAALKEASDIVGEELDSFGKRLRMNLEKEEEAKRRGEAVVSEKEPEKNLKKDVAQ